jgi:hypothetical protein
MSRYIDRKSWGRAEPLSLGASRVFAQIEIEEAMRILSRILIVIVAFVASGAAPLLAQARSPFDPEVDGVCDKELGGPPQSGWIGDERAWNLQCAELDLSREGAAMVSLRTSEAGKSNAERDAYDALAASFERYRAIAVELDEKGCGGGNSCSSDNALVKAHITYEFIVMAEGFTHGALPSYSAADAAAADAALNAAYQRTLSSYPIQCTADLGDFCAPRSRFRDCERAWLRYRDAWVTYAAIKWPQVIADSWRTYLTLQRRKFFGSD